MDDISKIRYVTENLPYDRNLIIVKEVSRPFGVMDPRGELLLLRSVVATVVVVDCVVLFIDRCGC